MDEVWVNYSDLDKTKYTAFLTTFSLISSLITHPFNVIMTRQQAGILNSRSDSFVGLVKDNIHVLGFGGLFRGWLPIFVAGIPSQVLYLSIIESSREHFQWLMDRNLNAMSRDNSLSSCSATDSVIDRSTTTDGLDSELSTTVQNENPRSSSDRFSGEPSFTSRVCADFIQAFFSSVVANTVSLIPYVPAEVLSTRLIVQGRNGHGMVKMAKLIMFENGVRGFYKGFTVSLSFNVLFSAQWWWSYSVLRRECSKLEHFATNPQLLDASAGLMAGLFTTCCLHPIDTLKTRIMSETQSTSTLNVVTRRPHSIFGNRQHFSVGMLSIPKYPSMFGTLRDIIRTEGSKVLWRGLKASMYQSVLASSGFALSYEAIKRFSLKD